MNPAMPREQKPFRGQANSGDYNEFTRKMFFDITNLFNIANQLEDDLAFALESNRVTNTFIQMKLSDQDRLIREMQLEKQGSNLEDVVIARDMLVDDTSLSPAEIDKHYNIVTIPTTGDPVSKLFLTDKFTGEIILPRMLNALVEPPADGVVIQDSNFSDSIKGDGLRFWRRKVVKKVSDLVSEISAQVIIDLPEAVITNRFINMLMLHPYPCGMVDIVAVEYSVDGGWLPLPGFESANDAKDIVIQCPLLTINQIRVTLRQRHHLTEGEKKVFYLGLQRIGIYSASYKIKQGDFLIPLVLKGEGQREINTVTPLLTNAGALTDTTNEKRSVFSYSIYEVDEYGNLIFTRNTLPVYVNSNNIIIKASLNADPNNGAIPTLEAVNIGYKTGGP